MNRRMTWAAGLVVGLFVFLWHHQSPSSARQTAKTTFAGGASRGSGHIETYFGQVFADVDPAPDYAYPALTAACAAAEWSDDAPYLNCVSIEAGMTSIVSQIKVCLKMAAESGAHLVLPRMPLRDSANLLEFNFLNQDAYMPYDKWFDADHLRRQLGRACPRMKILHPDELAGPSPAVQVRHRFAVMCADAPGYEKLHSYFWAGRPFPVFFHEQVQKHRADLAAQEANGTLPFPIPATGITVVDTDSEFMVFRLTDDPTGRDLRVWTDLAHLVRFRADVRGLVGRLLGQLERVSGGQALHYGVHFRAENDSIWSTAEHQLEVDLDALDRAWAAFGQGGGSPKPPVYLACGDAEQVARFAEAGQARGWTVTHKWALAQAMDAADGGSVTAAIDAMPFDFQGAVDMGVMVRSHFFIGLQGSAFSSTIGNMRDITGRYRGSSLEGGDDEGARTHLFNDLDASEYACCL